MAYDEAMAERIRDVLQGVPGLVERKMFGGIGWTINGNMAAGAHKDGNLMIRAAKEDWAKWIQEPGVDAMKRGGKGMSGWTLVFPDTVEDDAALLLWVGRGRDYAAGLPPKKKK